LAKCDFKGAGTVIKIPENDLKITYTLGSSVSDFYRIRSFEITKTDGTKYIFGKHPFTGYQATELSTVNQNVFKTATSWKLIRIESADGNYSINFAYTPEAYAYGSRDKSGPFGSGGNNYNKE
jgi:hypothetical protein